VLALTHARDDHLGETTLHLCRQHRPLIVEINELTWWLEGQVGPGYDFQRMNKRGTHRVRGVRISMTGARHSSSVSAVGVLEHVIGDLPAPAGVLQHEQFAP
jgi:hypothetical protein